MINVGPNPNRAQMQAALKILEGDNCDEAAAGGMWSRLIIGEGIDEKRLPDIIAFVYRGPGRGPGSRGRRFALIDLDGNVVAERFLE